MEGASHQLFASSSLTAFSPFQNCCSACHPQAFLCCSHVEVDALSAGATRPLTLAVMSATAGLSYRAYRARTIYASGPSARSARAFCSSQNGASEPGCDQRSLSLCTYGMPVNLRVTVFGCILIAVVNFWPVLVHHRMRNASALAAPLVARAWCFVLVQHRGLEGLLLKLLRLAVNMADEYASHSRINCPTLIA